MQHNSPTTHSAAFAMLVVSSNGREKEDEEGEEGEEDGQKNSVANTTRDEPWLPTGRDSEW